MLHTMQRGGQDNRHRHIVDQVCAKSCAKCTDHDGSKTHATREMQEELAELGCQPCSLNRLDDDKHAGNKAEDRPGNLLPRMLDSGAFPKQCSYQEQHCPAK